MKRSWWPRTKEFNQHSIATPMWTKWGEQVYQKRRAEYDGGTYNILPPGKWGSQWRMSPQVTLVVRELDRDWGNVMMDILEEDV